jgi:hypothetical protein
MTAVTQKRVAWALVVLVLAAAAVTVWLLRGGGLAEPDATSADATDATVVSAAVKSDVRDFASDAATKAYGYSWKTVSQDKAAARALMTSDMQRRYDRTMAGVVTSSQAIHTVVTAEVVDSALVSATSSYARVLVFVNQRTTDDSLEKPLVDLDRVLVTLRHDGGEWRVSELDAL